MFTFPKSQRNAMPGLRHQNANAKDKNLWMDMPSCPDWFIFLWILFRFCPEVSVKWRKLQTIFPEKMLWLNNRWCHLKREYTKVHSSLTIQLDKRYGDILKVNLYCTFSHIWALTLLQQSFIKKQALVYMWFYGYGNSKVRSLNCWWRTVVVC